MEAHNNQNQGNLFIVSAPSGAGKTTICNKIRGLFPELVYSISNTTREPREGEINGKDYFFITKSRFLEKIKNKEWAEWADVHGNYYGTSANFLKKELAKGKNILLDIDVQGMDQIVKSFPQSITIFIMAPSLLVLKQRLESRGTDDKETIELRLVNAEKEIEKKDIYDHVIVNDELEKAVSKLADIIQRHKK